MRYKRGFTLAEILIVLMVIGFIATMTVPTLMGGVTESQFKAGYKKAFNSISSIASMAKSTGKLPSAASAANALDFLVTMNNNMAVKSYVSNETIAISSGTTTTPQNYAPCLGITKSNTSYIGEGTSNCATGADPNTTTGGGWIITEDNMAYTVAVGGACTNSKIAVAQKTSLKDASAASCVLVVVDVNGLTKGPNKFDTQVTTSGLTTATNVAAANKMKVLTGDQFPIFIANNGATAGSETYLVTGRIIADAN